MAKLITRSMNMFLMMAVLGLGGFWFGGASAQAAPRLLGSYDGLLKICKESSTTVPVSGNFQFRVNGQTVTVAVGSCSAPIALNAGEFGQNYTITELQQSGSQVTGVRTNPVDHLISSDLAARTAVVKVMAGDTATQTVVTFTNKGTTTPPPPSTKQGRMTGGGSVFTGSGMRVTHGFTLRCDASAKPQRLEINWSGNRFHLESLTSATCIDDPSIAPPPPPAPFDTYIGTGTGRYNGVSGATITWTFTDAGEPGTSDTAEIVIKDRGGNEVLRVVKNVLNKGNHQAHR